MPCGYLNLWSCWLNIPLNHTRQSRFRRSLEAIPAPKLTGGHPVLIAIL